MGWWSLWGSDSHAKPARPSSAKREMRESLSSAKMWRNESRWDLFDADFPIRDLSTEFTPTRNLGRPPHRAPVAGRGINPCSPACRRCTNRPRMGNTHNRCCLGTDSILIPKGMSHLCPPEALAARNSLLGALTTIAEPGKRNASGAVDS
jgi:hypothetical protein